MEGDIQAEVQRQLEGRLGGVVGTLHAVVANLSWLLDTYCPLSLEALLFLTTVGYAVWSHYATRLRSGTKYYWLRWRNEYELSVSHVLPFTGSNLNRNETLMRAILCHISERLKEKNNSMQHRASMKVLPYDIFATRNVFSKGSSGAEECGDDCGGTSRAETVASGYSLLSSSPFSSTTASSASSLPGSSLWSVVLNFVDVMIRLGSDRNRDSDGDGNGGAARQNADEAFFFMYKHFARIPSDSSFDLREDSEDNSDDDDSNHYTGTVAASAKSLARNILVKLPGEGCKLDIGEGVTCTYTRRLLFEYNFRQVCDELVLRTRHKDGDVYLKAFANRCLDKYLAKLPQGPRDARYLMELQASPSADGKELLFSHYRLSDEKTFTTLFFPEKEKVLKLVDDFLHTRGRFAVEGFPRKLGFLLHGPSGTGKTSFVKALATYTKRSIVLISLDRITTNQQLFDIFYDRKYKCVGENGAVRFDMEDIIFLLEDVQGTGDLLHSRTRHRRIRRTRSARLSAATSSNTGGGGDVGSEDEGEEVDLIIKSPEEQERDSLVELQKPWIASLLAMASEQHGANGAGGSNAGGGGGTGASSANGMQGDVKRANGVGGWGSFPLLNSNSTKAGLFGSLGVVTDKLDLSGVLNVLDGAIDTPGRIVVMTTSQPEMLDPALVRPGRISTILKMDYITLPALLNILGLHYGDPDTLQLSATDSARVTGCINELEEEFLSKRKTDRPKEGHEEPTPGGLLLEPTDNQNAAHTALEVEKGRHSFSLTPAEVELLCSATFSLDEFLSTLRVQICKQNQANQAAGKV